MSKELLLKQIGLLDHKSDEFAEIFHAVNERYFTFEDPDEYQTAASVLNLVLHRGEEWMVEVLANIGNQLFEVVLKDLPASHISFKIKGKMYFLDMYRDKEALGSIHKMFRNQVIAKATATGATVNSEKV